MKERKGRGDPRTKFLVSALVGVYQLQLLSILYVLADVCSRQDAIRIHVYLTLLYLTLACPAPNAVISVDKTKLKLFDI